MQEYNSFIIRHIIQQIEIERGKRGCFFSATTIKRSNGQKRTFNCRLGVQKELTGKGMRYDAEKYDLLTVWDRSAKQYRHINLKGLVRLQVCKLVLIEDNKPTHIFKQYELAAKVTFKLRNKAGVKL